MVYLLWWFCCCVVCFACVFRWFIIVLWLLFGCLTNLLFVLFGGVWVLCLFVIAGLLRLICCLDGGLTVVLLVCCRIVANSVECVCCVFFVWWFVDVGYLVSLLVLFWCWVYIYCWFVLVIVLLLNVCWIVVPFAWWVIGACSWVRVAVGVMLVV